jgi:O-antigen/teichoic acid export membrane protein
MIWITSTTMMVKRIAKNSIVLLMVRILQVGFMAVFSIYAARLLGVADFGKWAFALAYTAFFLVFADFGLSTFVNQRTSRSRAESDSRIGVLVGNSLLLKVMVSAPAYAIMVGLATLLGHDNDTKRTICWLGLSVILNSFTVFLTGVFRGLEKMEYEAISIAWERPLIFIVGIYLLTNGYGIVPLAILFFVARLLTLFVAMAIYVTKVQRLTLQIAGVSWKALIVGALPFGIFLVLGTIYFQIDAIMLSLFQGDQAVGLFESVIRLTMVLMIIPEAFTEAIFPVLSRSFSLGQDRTVLYYKALKLMGLVGLPITIGLLGLADKIILSLYGAEYLPAIPALQILALMVCVRFLAYVPGVLLTSIDRQTTRMIVVGVCAVLNVVMNLIVIPRWGFVGAAYDTLVTNVVLLSLYVFFVWRSGYPLEARHWTMMLRILTCAGLLYVFVIALRGLDLLVLTLLGATLYLVSILLLGIVRPDELAAVRRLFTLETTCSQ